ncbi:MAG: DUF2795 domain-containing protein [Methanosarcina sp.]
MLTSRIQVEKFLKGIGYPAKKEALIEHAKKNHASNEILQMLENIPDKEYTGAEEISREFEGK